MIELYHFGFSTCSQKVRLVLAEKGMDFDSHEVNLIAGGQHDPAYVKLNKSRRIRWADVEKLVTTSMVGA